MSQKINRHIKWQGESLWVVGNFYPGYKKGDPDTPPEPDTFEIDTINWKAANVTDLLCADERVREDIEKIVMEAMHDEKG